jgi:hypothetical protein
LRAEEVTDVWRDLADFEIESESGLQFIKKILKFLKLFSREDMKVREEQILGKRRLPLTNYDQKRRMD